MAENNENDREFNLRETVLFDRRTVERHLPGLDPQAYAEHPSRWKTARTCPGIRRLLHLHG